MYLSNAAAEGAQGQLTRRRHCPGSKCVSHKEASAWAGSISLFSFSSRWATAELLFVIALSPPFTLTSTSASGIFVALCALTACSITRLKAGGTKQPSTGQPLHLRALHCSFKGLSTLDDSSKCKRKKGFCVTRSVPAAVAHQSLLNLSQLAS